MSMTSVKSKSSEEMFCMREAGRGCSTAVFEEFMAVEQADDFMLSDEAICFAEKSGVNAPVPHPSLSAAGFSTVSEAARVRLSALLAL